MFTSPIEQNSEIIIKGSHIDSTSGNFSFNYNKNMAFGYIESKIDKDIAKDNFFEIEVEKIKYKAHLQTKPLHDPENSLIKS